MNHPCVGFLELNTIAKGILVVDALLKKATINVHFSYPVSSGKYIIAFGGEVEEVKSAFSVGKEIAGNALIDSFLLTNIHPQIFPCLKEKIESQEFEALGILETHTCASCIVALDCALKTSKVRAIKLELAKGIGGKAYFVIEGEVGEIESAMLSASRVISKQNIIEKIVIPQAAHSLKKIFE
ncbi:MAG: BMC domain-containing protein [Candidatus Brocadiae bacterium]|nr:BMC domain-containing protein [Candidatus Brocadiia bacterium]